MHSGNNFSMRPAKSFNKNMRLHVFIAVYFGALCLACSSIPDGKIQGDIAQKLTSAGIDKVSVIVQNGGVTLTGQVPDESLRGQAETLAKSVEGVRSVQSSVIVVFPTPEPTPEIEITENEPEEADPAELWQEKAMEFLIEYMKPRMATCGDSYFVLIGKTGLYQTKVETFVEIFEGKVLPAEELSEADKLNGKVPAPERWLGRWGVRIGSPWRYYYGDRWGQWRDDPPSGDVFNLRYSADGKWEFPPSLTQHGQYEKIGKYKCYDNDIDIESIPGGPGDKPRSQSNSK